MNIAYTPAPWDAETAISDSTDSAFRYSVRVFAFHDNDAIPVADFTDQLGFRPLSECQGNAALTAAVPEMYAVILAILAGNNRSYELAQAAMTKIRAALPKET